MPNTVRRCYESVLKNKGRFNVVLLDLSNFSDYVDIPDVVIYKQRRGLITLTHFSDILRFALIAKYGGYWLDATIYVTSEISMPRGFFTVHQPECSDYVSRGRWCGFLWYAPREHPFARFCYEYYCEYWRSFDKLLDYFLMDYVIEYIYEKYVDVKREIDDLPVTNPDMYFFQEHVCEEIYEDVCWKDLCNRTQFFKTTWKKKMVEEKNGKKTYYGRILGDGFDNNTCI